MGEGYPRKYFYTNVYWGEPHTSESDGTSDRLRKLLYSSIDNLNYTENSQNGLLTIYLSLTLHHKTLRLEFEVRGAVSGWIGKSGSDEGGNRPDQEGQQKHLSNEKKTVQ